MLSEFLPLLRDFETTYSFLKEKKVLNSVHPRCVQCQKEMTLIKYNDEKIFRCPTHKGVKVSIRKNSYLEKSRLKLRDFLTLTFSWSLNIAIPAATALTGLSKSTVIQWYYYIRDITSNHLHKNPYQIGGVGHIVEIGEWKYNRGGMPQGRFVFGGWDREDKNGFLAVVPDHSSESLLPVIEKFIRPGTTVYSDSWGAYNGIAEMDVTPKYIHFTVNHSKNFVDPVTHVHTNSVACYWKNAKRRFKTMMGAHSNMMELYLDEFLWKNRYGKCGKECFENILKHLSEWYTFEEA